MEELRKAFHESFSMYEELFAVLTDEGFYERADPLRHPLIFYLGHTASFYVNKLIAGQVLKNSERINPKLESSFAVGVDEMDW
jgi:hypothetical protein